MCCTIPFYVTNIYKGMVDLVSHLEMWKLSLNSFSSLSDIISEVFRVPCKATELLH